MGWFKKLQTFLLNGFDIPKDSKVSKENIRDLKKKTKLQLEKIGRKLGVELDRRLTKSKLINKIKKLRK
jgi:predicted DNA-binding protein YlxM (UPF0122 family)|tara:strand:+ start:226 stop:432 length:207 start_codon:yes stop_codon:yes gene_type:complete